MSGQRQEGLICKAISGFYYVQTETERLECKAKGVFRKQGISPLVGDTVAVVDGVVSEILPRRNELLRPPAANLDLALLVVSTTEPEPSLLTVDKLIAICEQKGIEPAIVLTKNDLRDGEALRELYCKAGFSVFSAEDRTALLEAMRGKICIFIGNTGAGKSTLLNRLFPELALATGEISQKLGRGRHTTRHVELFPIPGGGYVADTPGFGSVELEKYEHIRKQELQDCFREFAPYLGKCQFLDCSHRVEKGCAVLAAKRSGLIAESRHQSYCALYEEAMKIKEWELK